MQKKKPIQLRGTRNLNVIYLSNCTRIDSQPVYPYNFYGSLCTYFFIIIPRISTHTHTLTLAVCLEAHVTLLYTGMWPARLWLQHKCQPRVIYSMVRTGINLFPPGYPFPLRVL